MALRGDLASVDLAQVFQMLALNQKVGLLYIQSPRNWKALYFNDNGVTLYFNEHTMLDRVLARLVRAGHVSANGVLEAREHAAHQGHQVVDSLLAGDYLTEEELDRAVSTEIEEEIYELFFWHDAKFEFYEGATDYEGREGVIHDQFFFGTDAVIMEAARRIDEWGHIKSMVPSTDTVFRVCATDARAYELADELFQVFELTDGMRSVERIIEITGKPSFHVHKTLCALLEEEVITPLQAEEYLKGGQDCMTEGRTQDACNLYERAVEFGVGLPGVHTQASKAYQAAGEFERSTHHIKLLAEHHAATGNLKKAAALFREALEMIPTDLAACQRVVELSIDHPELASDDFDPLNVGKDLVDLYIEMGEIGRVRTLLEELIREHPADIELKKSLINVHTKVGDTKRVIELYESIAEDLTKSGDPIQAIKYLQKILQLNRARTDISEWIKRLYQVDERLRSRRRSLVALGIVFTLLVLASVGYFFYNRMARDEYDTLAIQGMFERKKFTEARKVIEDFIDRWPLTMVVADAREELVHIKARERQVQEEQEAETREKRQALERIRFEYRAALQQHKTLFASQDLERALRAIEECRALVKKAGQPLDTQWAKRNQLDKNHADLVEYLTSAARLAQEARKAKDEKDWKTHRKVVLELVTLYELSDVARRAQLSVLFTTQPPGAMIYQDGQPVTEEVKGKQVPVVTPTIVLCANQRRVEYELRMKGFESQSVALDPKVTGAVSAVMSKLPISVGKFGSAVLDGPGVNESGRLVVGLAGGKVAYSADGVATTWIQDLEGLRELYGVPATSAVATFFRTNTGEIECRRLSDGRRLWVRSVKAPLTQDPMVANNRLFLADRDGVLLCLSASQRGNELWQQRLKGAIVAQPFVHDKDLAVGSQLGTVLVVDVLGTVEMRLQLDVGVTTEVLMNDALIAFGTEDGKLICYSRSSKKEAWSLGLQRAIRAGEMTLSEDGKSVFVVGADKELMRVDLASGKILSKRKLVHPPMPGMSTLNGLLIVVTQIIERKDNQAAKRWDVLQAVDPESLETVWRFTDGGTFRGRPARGASRLYLTGSRGEVYRFL